MIERAEFLEINTAVTAKILIGLIGVDRRCGVRVSEEDPAVRGNGTAKLLKKFRRLQQFFSVSRVRLPSGIFPL